MKKNYLLVLIVVFLAGCGSNPSESKFRGVTSKKDYVAQGVKFLNDADIARAIQSFDMAIKQDPQNSKNYMILGQVYMQLKNYPSAVDSLSAATRVDPNNPEAHYLLAVARALHGDREEAIESAKRSADLFMAHKDEDRFIKSVALVRGLMEEEKSEMEVSEASEAKSSVAEGFAGGIDSFMQD